MQTTVVRQFHNPQGVGGRVAGWIMGHRSSNVARNRWAVELLGVRPTDRALELGCGPGVALHALAVAAVDGLVVGVDHSAEMVRQAARRNAASVDAGRVVVVQCPVEDLPSTPPFDEPFDVVLAVNTVGFWPQPVERLGEVRSRLRPGGRIALVSQPRCPGATAATSAEAGHELGELLEAAGFSTTETATLDLDPPAVCVLALA